jgi:FkbM family methyltransferase
MRLAEDYGISDGAVGTVTRSDFESLMRKARDDEYLGLPKWCREVGIESVRASRFWVFGTTEFSTAFRYCISDDAIIGYVDYHRAGQKHRGRPIVTGEEFLRCHAASPNVICLSGARYDVATCYFRALSQLAGARMLNFEQAVRVLSSPRLDYRLADHRPFIIGNIEKYLELEERLDDSLSKETLRRVTLFHLTTCREFYRHVERPYPTLYFRSGIFELSPHERFVDCGASIGESISNLLTITNFRFECAWLIEPDKHNVATLNALLKRFDRVPGNISPKIKLIPAAVGAAPGSVPFSHMGGHGGYVLDAAGGVDGGQEEPVQVVRLDDVIDAAPTFIKMDIEGSELDALRGAAGTIKQYRPRLAVSAYHRGSDLISLTEYVLSLRPDYKVGLRHHTPLRWDTCLYFF